MYIVFLRLPYLVFNRTLRTKHRCYSLLFFFFDILIFKSIWTDPTQQNGNTKCKKTIRWTKKIIRKHRRKRKRYETDHTQWRLYDRVFFLIANYVRTNWGVSCATEQMHRILFYAIAYTRATKLSSVQFLWNWKNEFQRT